jgi:hypothetical protein
MRSKAMLLGLGGSLLLATVVGCSSDKAAEKSEAPTKTTMAEAVNQLPLPITGKVAEAFERSGYSYIRLETATGERWVATSEAGFQNGDEVTILDGSLMFNFHSPTLDRTFPEIIFAASVEGGSQAAIAASPAAATEGGAHSFAAALEGDSSPHGGMGGMKSMGGMGNAPAGTALADIKVEKAAGKNAYRVEELFQQAAELNGQEVKVRGQVMKVSANIMGRNWIHLQDGSGDTAKNNHNLVVSSEAMPETGKVVTVTGVFQANKDLGAGYKYAAMVEDAKIEP